MPRNFTLIALNKRTKFHMTIMLYKLCIAVVASCQPFGAGLAFKNFSSLYGFTKIMSKAKKIKAPA
jgi:hypothetical protein